MGFFLHADVLYFFSDLNKITEPTLKSHFYENVPLIVNKLQRQKI